MEPNIRLGISRCLLGDPVRFDGNHSLDRFLVKTLGAYVDYFPVCPEVECGMGVPRETLRLVGEPENPRLMTFRTKKDYTSQMQSWACKRVSELERENLCGFIFKSKSPSSGMERVKVYNEKNGIPSSRGVGLFARAFMDYFPLLPVEEEGRLHDPALRENFIERIFVYRRWRELIAGHRKISALVDFHTRHKLLVLSHSTVIYREMGRLVARVNKEDLNESFKRYQTLLMEALRLKATVKKHINVLQHMAGYFKKMLSPDEKKELMGVIDQYGHELVPLIVPVTLLNHYVLKYKQTYLKQQFYLNPHPMELKLRNHV